MKSAKSTPKRKLINVNPNTIETETTRKEKVDLDPRGEFCLKQIPISLGRIERIKDSLRNWFDENPEAKTIAEFYHTLGISHKTYYSLLQRDPELKELHEITLRRLGAKLWGKACDFKMNWAPVKFMLHHYAPEYKEAKEFEAKLAKRDDVEVKAPQIVVIERFPDSDLVPEKKERE